MIDCLQNVWLWTHNSSCSIYRSNTINKHANLLETLDDSGCLLAAASGQFYSCQSRYWCKYHNSASLALTKYPQQGCCIYAYICSSVDDPSAVLQSLNWCTQQTGQTTMSKRQCCKANTISPLTGVLHDTTCALTPCKNVCRYACLQRTLSLCMLIDLKLYVMVKKSLLQCAAQLHTWTHVKDQKAQI